ncbi:Phenylalanyl-tRNA synthetase beta chain [hydrothermal vent metagenome]|uniref:Phenylalanine--tRNA ligase beta subunit n=1 Tax=hydrothermal vent metagenome TaxID=652676 RepID=A0A3B1C4U7_9ZZZZ
MLVSYLWLKDFCDIDASPEEVSDKLTSLGLECSIIDDRRGWYEGVVAGKIIEAVPHPEADKLQILQVDVGGETKNIVCGAKNAKAGLLVPVFLVGSVTPDGLKIEKRKLRGVLSEGMIPSEVELKLSEDHEGIMTLDDNPAPGDKFAERYEVCDTVLEVDLTPNRGDCLSMIGIAREVAEAFGLQLKKPDTKTLGRVEEEPSGIEIELTAPDLCPRYAGQVINDVKIKKSPFWVRRRLLAGGVRAINNIVDITNYVLIETGHPLHAFDLDMLAGSKIIVRRANDGEKFTTLDGKEHKLATENLVIADAEKAVALAGVMGGQNSEVTSATKNIMLESAYFNPQSIRKTSKKLNISSESSYRFERGTDIEGLIYAQDRAVSLIESIGEGSATGSRADSYPERFKKRDINLRVSRIAQILGIDVPCDQVISILKGLEMEPEKLDDDTIAVKAPFFRNDIEREIDLVEEIARCVGYDKVPSYAPETPVSEGSYSHSFHVRRIVRRHLVSIGLTEGMSLSFMGDTDIDKLQVPENSPLRSIARLDNPMSSEWKNMRTTLLPALISSAKGVGDLSIFETGALFFDRENKTPAESWSVACLLTETISPDVWAGKAGKRDFYDVKGVVESILNLLGFSGEYGFKPSSHPCYYPKRQADILIDSVAIGHMGQVHPLTLENYEIDQELFVCELNLDKIAEQTQPLRRHKGIAKFPSVRRDLAVVVDETVTAKDILESVSKHLPDGDVTLSAQLFDVFRDEKLGAEKKSMALALEFTNSQKTLTDEDADMLFSSILKGLEKDHGAHLR